MKRPFYAVKNRKTNKLVSNVWYNSKMEAKEERNSLNPDRPDDFVVGTPEQYYLITEEKNNGFISTNESI